MIHAENLTKKFNEFLAVDRVNLEVNSGEVLAMLGPNGAGKTTTLRMLTSVLRPTSGSARVAGYDVVTQSEGVRSSVGILTEQHGLYGRMTALEYLDFYGQIYRMAEPIRRKRSQELLEQFGLCRDAKRKIGEYSKGMRQKLALARALFHNPPVLLMDEPTSAMDPESARLVRDAIHSLRSANRAIIICTHNLAEAEELAGKIAIIHLGRIITAGEVKQLKYQLLGAPQFEIHLGLDTDHAGEALPEAVKLVSQGPGWLRYQVEDPVEMNPLVVQAMVRQNIPVVSLAEVPRSLESVYLQAINAAHESDGNHFKDQETGLQAETNHAG